MILFFIGGRSDGGILMPLAEELGGEILGPVEVKGDFELAIAQSAAYTAAQTAQHLDYTRPRMLVVLGDRFEALAAATAAYEMGVPICHLHGGEITLGSRDNSRRDAITALADLHLTATYKAAERVRALGKDNVHTVGSIGAHSAYSAKPAAVDMPLIIVAVPADPEVARVVHEAVEPIQANKVVVGPNADLGHSEIQGHTWAPHEFLSLLKAADVIVGNTSAGIIEAPSAGTWTVNVGDRQSGRERAASVIDVGLDAQAIRDAVTEAMRRPLVGPVDNPYYHGDAVKGAAEIIREFANLTRWGEIA